MQHVYVEGNAVTPSKVVCVGRNYVAHIKELGNEVPEEMVLFCKPNSAVTDTLYYIDAHTRFEGEICLMIRQQRAAAVGFGLDLTRADIQNRLKQKGLPWERAKAFDASAVFGEFVPLDVELSSLSLRLYRNGTIVQQGGVERMLYKPETILREIASFMTLEDGDIVMTGTPEGVGTYARGDRFRGEIFSGERLLVASEWEAL